MPHHIGSKLSGVERELEGHGKVYAGHYERASRSRAGYELVYAALKDVGENEGLVIFGDALECAGELLLERGFVCKRADNLMSCPGPMMALSVSPSPAARP